MSRAMLTRLGIAVAVEVSYALITRAWLPSSELGIRERELAITAIRGLTVPIYCVLFLDVIRSRRKLPSIAPTLLFSLGILVVLLAPMVTGDWRQPARATRVWFLIASLVVAVREEVVYRGVLQTLLERRMGWIAAVGVSNLAFVAYHYGAWTFTPFRVLTVFLVGSVLGILYRGTGSLRVPIVVHAAYEALASVSPLVSDPLPRVWATAFQLAALTALVLWLRRRRLA